MIKLFFNVGLLIFSMCLLGCKSKKINTVNRIKTIHSYKPINVKIYEQTSRTTLGPCEPSIAINYKNPKNMVVGSVLDYVHRSIDGGKNWQTKQLESKYGIWGDPTVVCDSSGNFYYFHLSDPDKTNWKSKRILDRIVVQKSINGGAT